MIPQFETACKVLEDLHAEIIALLETVGSDGMNWTPELDDVNSMYAIANHTILSQYWWIQENLNQEKIERNRPAEFTARAEDLDSLSNLYKEIELLTQNVLEKIPQEETQALRTVKQRQVTVEWIVLHVIEHTALHLGHMQLMKQLWENDMKGTGI